MISLALHTLLTLRHLLPIATLALGGLLVCGCANVRFEKSPYALRGLDIVYSQQEDMTFLVWRLRAGADPSRVSFELFTQGAFRSIDLDNAPFPADPFPCGDDYLCFQYQVPGRYTWPEGTRPLRSIHVSEGLYAGTEPRFQTTDITFGVDPIALGRNTSIDPRQFDWFELNDIPLQRDYDWQLVPSPRPDYAATPESPCDLPRAAAWRTMGPEVTPSSPRWFDDPACFASRPARRDAPGVLRVIPFPPSAILASERQDYIPREERPPVIYAYLFDTLVRGESRCQRTFQLITREIDRSIGARAPGSVRLGTFTPLDPQTGRPLSGCAQRVDQDYPVRQLIEALKTAAAEFEPQQVRFVLVYVNNVELPPSQRSLDQLDELIFELVFIENITTYTYAIGSNVTLSLYPWDATLGWRPVDDKTFAEDLRSWGMRTIPFRTMLHDAQTRVLINEPVPVETRPTHFKVCSVTPQQLVGVGGEPQRIDPPGQPFYTWPQTTSPFYLIALEEQSLIPDSDYLRSQVSLVVETCERFCELPFRSASGVDYPRWLGTERCQWRR